MKRVRAMKPAVLLTRFVIILVISGFLIIFSLPMHPIIASELDRPIPAPDRNGDYSGKVFYLFWEVVHPEGVNGHLSNEMPLTWYVPDISWPRTPVSRWPVIRHFPRGTVLRAYASPAGYVTHKDGSGSWLIVDIGGGPDRGSEMICMVRANEKLVKPSQTEVPRGALAFNVATLDGLESSATIYSGPGSSYRSIATVTNKECFLDLSKQGEWRRVMVPSGKTGYLHASRIKRGRAVAYGAATVESWDKSQVLYEGPSKQYPVIGHVPSESVVMLLAPDSRFPTGQEHGSWARVMTGDGKIGFINTGHLKWLPL